MKRFLLFGFEQYYPSGGVKDFLSAHETLDEAMAAGDNHLHKNRPDRLGSGGMHIAEFNVETGEFTRLKQREFDYDSGQAWTTDD